MLDLVQPCARPRGTPRARFRRSKWKAPLSSQRTTSPSIKQDRTLRWVTASTNEQEPVRPVIAAPGNQADADGISALHKAIAVVLIYVLEPDGGLSARVGRQGSMNFASVASRLPRRSINMRSI